MQVPADDVNALYNAMEAMVLNPDRTREWGRPSREVASSLTPEAGAEKWVRVFDCLINSSESGGRVDLCKAGKPVLSSTLSQLELNDLSV
jgi:hypothetical protein